MLILLKKVITDIGVFYLFNDGGNIVMLSENEAKLRINKTVAKYRNCRLSRGVIGLKANCGSLKVEDTRQLKMGEGIINILASYDIPKTSNFVLSNECYFLGVYNDSDFIEENLYLLSKIDGVFEYDKRSKSVKTKFGTCSIRNISTGLKTLLNIKYMLKEDKACRKIINCNECGSNILEDLFSIVEGTNITLYFSHSLIYSGKSFSFIINKVVGDINNLGYYLSKRGV